MFFEICAIVGFASLLTYFIPFLSQFLILGQKEQDLKKKYSAEWALVTGGSSGIGLAIVHKLAVQGINVVIVALENTLVGSNMDSLISTFPDISFRMVGCDLSKPNYLEIITNATNDIPINIVFNNAGYIKPGLFADLPLDVLLDNYNANATCTIGITHHFLGKMIERKQSGLLAFTGSSGGFIPGPMSSIYSSTKAWMTNFVASLAAEVIEDRIDVMCVHPSPIASNFYNNSSGMAALEFVKQYAASPEVIASTLFKLAGRACIIDQGFVSVMFKMVLKVLDWNLLSDIMIMAVRSNGDYKSFRNASKIKKEAKKVE